LTKWLKIPIIFKIKGKIPFLHKNILCIEISKNDVYIEYSDSNFEYISFTKAKKIILKELPDVINYACVDKEKSINFLNILLNKYKIVGSTLILK